MASSLNKCMLIGHLGRDPEIRYTQGGDAVANFSIATSETWKDKGGKKQERTEWHNLVAYRHLAEIIGQYVRKGAQVYIEGKLQTRKWQDKQTGGDRYITEIVCDQLLMLGRNGERQEPGQHQQQPAQRPAAQQERVADDFADDDIPF